MPPQHPLSRREFLATTAASGLAASGLAAACTRAAGSDVPPPRPPLVHVGTYTDRGRTDGVFLFRLDADAGALRPAGPAEAVGPNPSFLAVRPGRRALYAVNEVMEWEGRPSSGGVSAFAVDGDTGELVALGPPRASHGGAPCYVSVDRTGRVALVANYMGGNVASLPIAADGTLGAAASVLRHEGPTGPNAARQEGAHAHCIIPDPSNRYALAADLGLDRIYVYRLDDRAGTLAPAATPFVAAAPGAGPRHLAFHPSGRVLYAVNELDLTLSAFRWDADPGTLTPAATVSLLDAGPRPAAASEWTAADLHVAPSGRFLYASVRGDNSLSVLSLDAAGTTPTLVQRVSTGGNWPRNFALDPSGRLLFVANQRSNSIVAFRVDQATGRLTPTGQQVEVPSPVCVRFFR